ncbi:MAG: hypothetical protein LBU85_08470 [Treponema sp.]|jgi:hypothetical protein|nr:hypothetical protein [Treponema sp.]
MKKPFKHFLHITVLTLAVTITFINCEFLLEPFPEKQEESVKSNPPTPGSEYLGTWATEKNGIVKELEIKTHYLNYNYMLIQKTYINGELKDTDNRNCRYFEGFYFEGWTGKFARFFKSVESDDIAFSIQNNELTLGGGDIRYKSNSDCLEGKWSCELETYRIDITFEPFDKREGAMILKLTAINSSYEDWLGAVFYYSIKNNDTLILRGDESFNGKIVEITNGNILRIKNYFIQNEQIKKYNEAHDENKYQCEMFGLYLGYHDTSKISDLYNFFSEEYYRKP